MALTDTFLTNMHVANSTLQAEAQMMCNVNIEVLVRNRFIGAQQLLLVVAGSLMEAEDILKFMSTNS